MCISNLEEMQTKKNLRNFREKLLPCFLEKKINPFWEKFCVKDKDKQ